MPAPDALLDRVSQRLTELYGRAERLDGARIWPLRCGQDDRGTLMLRPRLGDGDLRAELTISDRRGGLMASVSVTITAAEHLDYLVAVVRAACSAIA